MKLSHVGVIVPDLEEGRARLAELLGVEWGPIHVARVPAGSDCDEDVSLRVCFSTDSPGVELLQAVPGTVWTCNELSNLHHISFFVDNVLDESRRLEGARCPLEYVIGTGDGDATLAYHRDVLGVRVELVSVAAQSNIRQHQTGGPT
jgi:catechol 2,3-dioxygenase-like lactoylglutathione lyase family enzyme